MRSDAYLHCLNRWPPNWGPRPAILDGRISDIAEGSCSLWLDPWTRNSSPPSSLGTEAVDSWVAQMDPNAQEFFHRVKLFRNHMLLTLLCVDEVSRVLSDHSQSKVDLSESYRLMLNQGLSIPEGWWSLVGSDTDLDEYGLRSGIELEDRVLYQIEGWRVSDAVTGVSTTGADPYDSGEWLSILAESELRKSRQASKCPWVDGAEMSLFRDDRVLIEFFLHEEVANKASSIRSTARECFEFRAKLTDAVVGVMESAAMGWKRPTFARPT